MRARVGFSEAVVGAGIFFGFQYVVGLVRLGGSAGGMENKFSALAREEYLGFLVWENVYVLVAYGILVGLFALVLAAFLGLVGGRWKVGGWWLRVGLCLVGAFLIHGFFTLRLVETRPYFLSDAKFGYWYFEVLNAVPVGVRPGVFFGVFKVLPVVVLGYAGWFYLRRLSGRGWAGVMGVMGVLAMVFWWRGGVDNFFKKKEVGGDVSRPNVIILGSDSLRSDRLGCNGYVPRRGDGLAVGGVSPRIDELAGRSVNFRDCYVPLASTLESGTTLMSSLYPHSHGLRQMYPDEGTVRAVRGRIEPIAGLLARRGYDTAAYGDWCAGYYELMGLGMGRVAVSSFDNFKIYMSQAVVMAHFVVPLYFDHALGYKIFPELGSFAQFVTPGVVTGRVEEGLARVARSGQPFFWHVFYSCNHLPYRNPEPYASMFTDPGYVGKNKTGVDFDIDSFIGGTDLENKWKVLPEVEVRQIRDLYDGCTRQFDDEVGKVLDALKREGLAGNTIVIVTADHGDNLYEEGTTLGHGLTFNGDLHANRVPLVFYVPGVGGRKISEQVRLIDLAPTVADLTGTGKPVGWEGVSFAGWIEGREVPAERAFYGETGFPFVQFRVAGIERPRLPPMDEMTFIDDSFNYQFVLKREYQQRLVDAKQRVLATPRWKLICTPMVGGGRHFALYDRVGGGAEVDVSAEHPEIVAAMRVALEKWMDERVETRLEEIF